MEMYQRLMRQFGNEFLFGCRLWRLDVLTLAPFRESAVEDAVKADLILFSVRSGNGLHADVRSWVEAWLPRKRAGQSAIVALMEQSGSRDEGGHSLVGYLQEIALRGKMELLVSDDPSRLTPQVGGAPPGRAEGVLEQGTLSVETMRTMGFTVDMLSQPEPPSRWGINE